MVGEACRQPLLGEGFKKTIEGVRGRHVVPRKLCPMQRNLERALFSYQICVCDGLRQLSRGFGHLLGGFDVQLVGSKTESGCIIDRSAGLDAEQ